MFSAECTKCRVHGRRSAPTSRGRFGGSDRVIAMGTPSLPRIRRESFVDQLRKKFPKLAVYLDDAKLDMPAFMDFPKAHRKQLASTNPLR
jgi:putative transposase